MGFCPTVRVEHVLTMEGHMSLIHMQLGLIVVYFHKLLGDVSTRKLVKIHFFPFSDIFSLFLFFLLAGHRS